MDLLTVENLTFTYPLGTAPAVRDLSFSVRAGDFAVLCGATGSGKSTLLRLLKRELAPLGEKTGRVLYRGTPVEDLPAAVSARSVGFVMQMPEQQIVTDKVWHELAFGLENLGVPEPEIARRVAEMASYFGIEGWYDQNTAQLSGGQKQLLNLAAVMAMDPDILILDEPTAQLDPIAASDFIATLQKLNRDFSLTVLVAEHRLEELIPACDRLLVMENGRMTHDGGPRDVIAEMAEDDALLPAMPTAPRLARAFGLTEDCPLSVREGRRFLGERFSNRVRSLPVEKPAAEPQKSPALEFRDVCFRYDRDAPDVLHSLSLTVYEGEIFCVLGGNGSGKTTSLGCAAGLLRPYAGSIRVFGRKLKDYRNQSLYRDCLALLPQDVGTLFLRPTVREELEDARAAGEKLPFDLTPLYDKHPYDCSGGEQQLVALAKVLATHPRLLLMDEPTKALDAGRKREIARILKELQSRGVTVVVVTHDVEFAAVAADRCALFFRGSVVSVDSPDAFFGENRFYTTAACRMSRGFYDRAVTLEALKALCRLNGPAEADPADREEGAPC